MPTMPPLPENIGLIFALATLAYLLLCLAMLAPLFPASLVFRFLGQRKKVFFHLLAGQTAPLLVTVAVLVHLGLIAGVLVLGNSGGQLATLLEGSRFLQGTLAAGLAVPALLLAGGTRFKAWRKKAGAQAALLGLAALGSLVTVPLLLLCVIIMTKPGIAEPGLLTTLAPGADVFFETASAITATFMQTEFFPANLLPLGQAAGTGLALAGLCAGLMVTLRRDKDDFGRDYYTHATRTAAWWAFAGGLIFSIAAGAGSFYMVEAGDSVPYIQKVIACTAGLAGLGTLGWGAVGASRNPLRLKWIFFLSGLLFLSSFAALYLLLLPASGLL